MAWKSTSVRKRGGIFAVALGAIVCASPHTARAAGVDAADILLADASLGRTREAVGGYWLPAPHSIKFSAIRGPAAEVPQPLALATLHDGAARALALSGARLSEPGTEVLLRNSDALVRTKLRLPLSNTWSGFVYADLGAADSSLKWQGMAGIRAGHGVDLLGGWRHVTYHYSPGMGCDSLDFNGPFLGATLAW